ncbi:hypothetical protein LJC63_01145 [Ruminococcaceae bacterium OttesenSCG-928-L11]|nr:hypothetical protein [Ruminococcaceae bacterium OttesenSCG-928-L11]
MLGGIKAAARHCHIGNTVRKRFLKCTAKRRIIGVINRRAAKIVVQIRFENAVFRTEQNIAVVIIIILACKLICNAAERIGKAVARRNIIVAFCKVGENRRFMLLPKLPQLDRRLPVAGWLGVADIENIFQARVIAGIVDKRNALGATPHPTVKALVPEFDFGAGGGIGALCVDKKLVVKRVFIQPCRRIKKAHPTASLCG